MRMVCGVTGKRGFTKGERRLTCLSLELGMFVQERLKSLDLLTHSLQVDQKMRPECTGVGPTCTSSSLSLPTINFIPAYR